MPKSHALEDTLAELQRLRTQPTTAASLAILRKVLGGKTAYAAAKAAEIVGEAEIRELVPDLIAAFDRFMTNPIKSDPGCRAKAAIADALYGLAHDDASLFLRGIHHVQMEPVYGGREDTGTTLRGVCALGLVRMNYPDVLTELADLLADREAPARVAAARAIAYGENDNGVPLLRLKVLTGDDDPQVISECLTALLQLAPVTSLPFVGRLLDAEEVYLVEAAVLALGGSRRREAFDILRPWWERTINVDLRRTGLLAIAMLKHDAAIEFLLSLVAEAGGPAARDAIGALGVYKHDETLRQRVVQVATARDDVDLSAAVSKTFG